MKKITILILILTFCLTGFISGCSKDDDNGDPTGPSINPDDYDFYMVVSSTGLRSNYMLNVSPMETNTIQTLELTVNGSAVIMTNYMSMWVGLTDMTEGQTYQVEMTINSTDYSFTMITAYIPAVNWPNTWTVTEPTNLSWTLTSNAEYQEIYGTATDNVIWDEVYADLNASDRSFTIPANWVNVTLPEFNLMLMEMNFSFDDNLIINCMSASEMDYGILSESDKIRISKDITKRILNN